MDKITWWIWGLAGLALIIGEAFTPLLVLLPFGVAALLVALLAALGVEDMSTQFWIFSISAGVLVIFSQVWLRPFLNRRPGPDTSTNTNKLVGKQGRVTNVSDTDMARCRVMEEDWACVPEQSGQPLSPGVTVTVIAVEGVKLIVRPVPPS